MAVEGIADVGQHDRTQAEGLDPFLDGFRVARRQHAGGQHIDLLLAPPGDAGFRHQYVDHGFYREGEAGFEAAAEIRRIHRHHGDLVVLRKLLAKLLHQPLDVRALGFRQAGGR